MLKFCPGCGTKIEHENVKFCMNCGQALDIFRTESLGKENESAQNDFFSEAPVENNMENVPVPNTGNQDDFFDSMEDKADKENEADQALLREAEQLFMQYKLNEAKPILEDLASRNVWRAQYMLSWIYALNIDGMVKAEADYKSSMLIIEAGGSVGDGYEDNADALLIVLAFYRLIDDEEDRTEVLEEIRRRISKVKLTEDPLLDYELFMYYAKVQNDMKKAMSLINRSAENGNIISIITLASVDDHKISKKWALKGAQLGIPDCMVNLGNIFKENGNHSKAIEWYKKSLKIVSDPSCMQRLGNVYSEQGNDAKAIEWYEKSLEIATDNDFCGIICFLIGERYLRSDSVRDFDKAEYYLQKSLNMVSEDNEGLAYIIFLLGQTKICKRDFDNGKQLLQKAYELGDENEKREIQDLWNKVEEFERNTSTVCFITTAVCDSFGKPDDCYELTMFRQFRDTWLRNQEDGEALIKEYYAIAPRIVSSINLLDNAKEIYRSIWTDYLKPCLMDLESDNKVSCKKRYIQMVMDLKEKYLK